MYYFELNVPTVLHGISTRPGCPLSDREKNHFKVLSKTNSNGECTLRYITTKKPKAKLEAPKGGNK